MRNSTDKGFEELIIPSDLALARQIQTDVEEALLACRYQESDVYGIKLALEEALVNAIKHGNQLDTSKKVRIRYKVCNLRFEAHIQDEGPGFDPDEIPNPLAPENLERECGRGLLLMRHYMSEVTFHPPGNRVSIVKNRQPSKNGKH